MKTVQQLSVNEPRLRTAADAITSVTMRDEMLPRKGNFVQNKQKDEIIRLQIHLQSTVKISVPNSGTRTRASGGVSGGHALGAHSAQTLRLILGTADAMGLALTMQSFSMMRTRHQSVTAHLLHWAGVVIVGGPCRAAPGTQPCPKGADLARHGDAV